MSAKSLLKSNLSMSEYVLFAYLSDLSESDLYMQPHPNANSLAWQLGHLILSENESLGLLTGSFFTLPDGFSQAHNKGDAPLPAKLWSLAEYQEIFRKQRALTHELLENLTDQDLAQPAPEKMRSYAPTVGDLILVQGTHLMMHCGQIAVLRRALNKDIVM